jgi:hypothetical protein
VSHLDALCHRDKRDPKLVDQSISARLPRRSSVDYAPDYDAQDRGIVRDDGNNRRKFEA